MQCTECGATVENGLLYCPVCGAEIQYVPDYNILEEDIVDSFIGDKGSPLIRVENKEEKLKEIQLTERPMAKWPIILVVMSVALALTIILLVSTLVNRRDKGFGSGDYAYTYEYYLQQGQVLLGETQYENALAMFRQAVAMNPNSVDAMEGEAECLLKLNDREAAEDAYLTLINMSASNEAYYNTLIDLYDQDGMYDKIEALSEYTSQRSVLERIASYRVSEPYFTPESGTYHGDTLVSIESEDKNRILYTLDGTDPRDDGVRYLEEIALNEETKYEVKAVCVNDKGIFSDTVSAEYEVVFDAPDPPAPSIPSGEYLLEQTVSMQVPEGCKCYYTWDGSTPTKDSTPYTGPISLLPGSHVLSVISISSHDKVSIVAQFTYTLYTAEMLGG